SPAIVGGFRLISPAFSLNALIYLASLVVFAWGLKDAKRRSSAVKPANGNGKLEHYRRLLKSREVWAFIPAWLAIFAIVGMWINYSPALFTGSKHFEGQGLTGRVSHVGFGNGFAALAVFFALGVLAWSLVLGRYKKTSVMLLATF